MAESSKDVLPLNSFPDGVLATSGSDSVLTVPRNPSVSSQLVDPKTVYKHYSPYDLVSLAQEVQNADEYVQATTSAKLQVIVDQIRHLQSEAQKILFSAKENAQLHHAACNFVKVPGNTYHLYEKANGKTYFSMLSPEEWGRKPPNTYLGSYRLEYDRSWTPLSEVQERDKDIVAIQKAILAAAPAITHPNPDRTDSDSGSSTNVALFQ